MFAEMSQAQALDAEGKLAVEEKLQDTLQQVAALESELEAAKEAATELEVSLATHTMTKNVVEADLNSQIVELNETLENRSKALATAEARIQALTFDTGEQRVKRCRAQPVRPCDLAQLGDCTTVSTKNAGRSWRLESALCQTKLRRKERPTRQRWRTKGDA